MSKWFAINRLSLNVSKTNFILFCNSRKRYDKCEIKIMLNGIVLEQVKCAKFLGVLMNILAGTIIFKKLPVKCHVMYEFYEN